MNRTPTIMQTIAGAALFLTALAALAYATIYLALAIHWMTT